MRKAKSDNEDQQLKSQNSFDKPQILYYNLGCYLGTNKYYLIPYKNPEKIQLLLKIKILFFQIISSYNLYFEKKSTFISCLARVDQKWIF